MSANFAHKSFKLLVTGRSGSGKTTFWLNWLLATPARCRFIFDHEGECAARLGVQGHHTSEDIGRGFWEGWVLWDPAALFPGQLETAFAYFCELAFELSRSAPGRKIFACDELQKLTGTSGIPRELATVLETGRRYELDFAAISQQPNLIHNRIRNQLTEVVTFSQMDPQAVDWLECAGFDPEEIRELRPLEYIARNLNSGGELRGVVDPPAPARAAQAGKSASQ